MDTETLEIKFKESLSDSSVRLIKKILWDTLNYDVEIKRID